MFNNNNLVASQTLVVYLLNVCDLTNRYDVDCTHTRAHSVKK